MHVVVLLATVLVGAPWPGWLDALVESYSGDSVAAVQRAEAEGLVTATEARIALDWLTQDGFVDVTGGRQVELTATRFEPTPAIDALREEWRQLDDDGVGATDRRRFELYLRACHTRRLQRLAPFEGPLGRIAYTIHYDMGGSHYAYTEAQSDAQNERNWVPGASLNVLSVVDGYGSTQVLLEDAGGVIRDPDIAWDASTILFAWKRSLDEDDYHLYEMDVATGAVTQLTRGLGAADYEGAYLPNGEIVFNSTRCVQTVDCWWTEVSNLYLLDPQSGAVRRATYDQVHTNYPTVTPDGRVIYTRWDYSDRGQIFPQGLFEMRHDATGQAALYGNNSYFPTTILHARAVPGTSRYVAIFTGHHTLQTGWLGLIDPSLGREENSGAQLIAPVRQTEAERIDVYGQWGDQFQYPYPLSETAFLASIRPEGWPLYGVYWVDISGNRELLAWDETYSHSCNQAMPLQQRPRPPAVPIPAQAGEEKATLYVQDVAYGPGLEGVEPVKAKRLRVVALEYRAAGIGESYNVGPAGDALVCTPVSIQGAWDVKRVLGTVPIEADGSALFEVPARTPLYFQVLDEHGFAIQSMRSWMTLQPGENRSCVGCHEDPNGSVPNRELSLALRRDPSRIEPWLPAATDDPALAQISGYDFRREVQPILDQHCIGCHRVPIAECVPVDEATVLIPPRQGGWRYSLERPVEGWDRPEFDDSPWLSGWAGFGSGDVPGGEARTPWTSEDIWLRRTVHLDAPPANPALLAHHDDDMEVWINGVLAASTSGYTHDYGLVSIAPDAMKAFHAGDNVIAVHAWQSVGGQYIDVGLVDLPAPAAGPPGTEPAFSLLGVERYDPLSRKGWSDGYRGLARRGIAEWINPQSAPPMLAPREAGAVASPLIGMLRDGHYGAILSAEEIGSIALWIDLLVPYYGAYDAGLSTEDRLLYQHFASKRERLSEGYAPAAVNQP